MNSNNSNPSTHADDFFVGYLPTPASLRRHLMITVAVVIVVVVSLSALLAANMRPTGPGIWDTDHVASITGLLHASPYAYIETADPRGGPPRAVLLVEEGKHGARESLKKFAGQTVTAKGFLLSRLSQSMLELNPDTDPTVVPIAATTNQSSAMVAAEATKFRGEIFDPKCYLGAMKPGAGKTHKGCAALCLRGGIPPMFASIDSQNRITGYYVLVGTRGEGISGEDLQRVVELVGEPVEVQGVVANDRGLLTLRIDPGRIARRDH